MKQSWYAVYTKLNCELKVTAHLNRKKIKNFCPVNNITNNTGFKKIWNAVPLFQSFVFVYIAEEEMQVVKQTNDVINFLFWLGKPAIISNEEVKSIERFTTNYANIGIEKTAVNLHAALQITSEPHIGITNNSMSAKYTLVKMLLPSLGYSIMASVETTTFKEFDSVANAKRNLVL